MTSHDQQKLDARIITAPLNSIAPMGTIMSSQRVPENGSKNLECSSAGRFSDVFSSIPSLLAALDRLKICHPLLAICWFYHSLMLRIISLCLTRLDARIMVVYKVQSQRCNWCGDFVTRCHSVTNQC